MVKDKCTHSVTEFSLFWLNIEVLFQSFSWICVQDRLFSGTGLGKNSVRSTHHSLHPNGPILPEIAHWAVCCFILNLLPRIALGTLSVSVKFDLPLNFSLLTPKKWKRVSSPFLHHLPQTFLACSTPLHLWK